MFGKLYGQFVMMASSCKPRIANTFQNKRLNIACLLDVWYIIIHANWMYHSSVASHIIKMYWSGHATKKRVQEPCNAFTTCLTLGASFAHTSFIKSLLWGLTSKHSIPTICKYKHIEGPNFNSLPYSNSIVISSASVLLLLNPLFNIRCKFIYIWYSLNPTQPLKALNSNGIAPINLGSTLMVPLMLIIYNDYAHETYTLSWIINI